MRLETAADLGRRVRFPQVIKLDKFLESKIENNTKIHYPFNSIIDPNFEVETHK